MSILSEQAKQLREKADMLDGLEGMDNLVPMLREAADTIESLRDRLQELQGVGCESRYSKLFGTPERAARTLSIMQRCELGIIGNCDDCEMHDACRVRDGDYDALLEWLWGDAE